MASLSYPSISLINGIRLKPSWAIFEKSLKFINRNYDLAIISLI